MTTEVAPPLAAGRLKLREVLGEGGVGTVYLAYDERLDVERAVKVLANERASNQVQRQRFLTEARIQARLRHPNIVEVYDIEDDGTQVYLVMELVAGGSLWDRLKTEGPMPPAEAAAAAAGILRALEQAHALDIVHRDIKPHNILITDRGVPKLADFGVAHLPSDEHSGVTRTGVVMGTWSFMAPEQRASSRRVDPRSDIYAVAATLYTLVTGHTEPDLFDFEQDSPIFERLPEPLRPVIHRATRYDRDERYPDAHTLREDLERCLPALDGTAAAPWPTLSATDAPDAAHHLVKPGRRAVPTTQDRPKGGDEDREARSGTLVPTPAEVERLLATPGARSAGATYSDDGHTMELPPGGAPRPDIAPAMGQVAGPAADARLDTAEGAVELSIGQGPDAEVQPEQQGFGWTIDDERQLTEEVAVADKEEEDEPIQATWRSAGRIRFLLFLLALVLGSAVVMAAQQGWVEPPAWAVELGLAPSPEGPETSLDSHQQAGREPDLTTNAPTEPPLIDPPISDPPISDPPISDPPISDPPISDPPISDPPISDPKRSETSPDSHQQDGREVDPATSAATDPPITAPAPIAASFPGLDPENSPPSEVHKRIRMLNEQDVWDCYHSALLTNPRLEGSLELHWSVTDGKVYSPKPLRTPDGHQDIGSCVAGAVAGWQYPPWFTNLPRIHTWNLKVIEQTQRLLSPNYAKLYACGSVLAPDEFEAAGRGRLSFVVEEGWVKRVHVEEGFDHPALQQCLGETAMQWRLPSYGRGQFNLNLTLEMVMEGE